MKFLKVCPSNLWLAMSVIFLSIKLDSASRKPIKVVILYPRWYIDLYGFKAAFELALQDLENSTLLPGYKIEPIFCNTDFKATEALYHTYKSLEIDKENDPKPLMFIGPSTSALVEVVQQALDKFYINVLSYAATWTERKKDKLDGSHAFSTKPSFKSYISFQIALLKKFNWNRVGVIYDYSPMNSYFTKFTSRLVEELVANNITVVAVEPFNSASAKDNPYRKDSGVDRALTKIKELDVRVVLGEFDNDGTLQVFCKAFEYGLLGEKYVWLLHPSAFDGSLLYSMFERFVYSSSVEYKSCKLPDIYSALHRAFLPELIFLRQDDVPTDSGRLPSEYFQVLESRLAPTYYERKINQSTLAYDALWNVARVFDQMVRPGNTLGVDLDNCCTPNKTVQTLIAELLQNTSFPGISGDIVYSSDGDRLASLTMTQLIRHNSSKTMEVKKLGIFHKDGQLDFYPSITVADMFEAGKVPLDRALTRDEVVTIPLMQYAVSTMIAAIGVFISLTFLGFNYCFRKHRLIRLSGPLYNNIMAIGLILCLTSVILFGITGTEQTKDTFITVCKVRIWVLMVGFSMAFGSMFVKTFRVYRIFTNKRLKVSLGALSDSSLCTILFVIVVIDIIILCAWELVDEITVAKHQFSQKFWYQDSDNPDMTVIPHIYFCTSEFINHWKTTVFVTKALLLLYGLFLAFETRNVAYAHLNDSKLIGLCVYNVGVMSAIGAFMGVVLDITSYKEMFIIMCLSILFPSMVTLCLVFLPKIITMIKEPLSEVNPATSSDQLPAESDETNKTSFEICAQNKQQQVIQCHDNKGRTCSFT